MADEHRRMGLYREGKGRGRGSRVHGRILRLSNTGVRDLEYATGLHVIQRLLFRRVACLLLQVACGVRVINLNILAWSGCGVGGEFLSIRPSFFFLRHVYWSEERMDELKVTDPGRKKGEGGCCLYVCMFVGSSL